MTGMEDVLAAHGGHAFGREEADESRWFDKCDCGHLLFGIDYSPEHKVRPGKSYANAAFAAHVAQALTAAGFGSLHDAWAEGHRTTVQRERSGCGCGAWSENECACGKYGTGKIITPNPYPKVSET